MSSRGLSHAEGSFTTRATSPCRSAVRPWEGWTFRDGMESVHVGASYPSTIPSDARPFFIFIFACTKTSAACLKHPRSLSKSLNCTNWPRLSPRSFHLHAPWSGGLPQRHKIYGPDSAAGGEALRLRVTAGPCCTPSSGFGDAIRV